MKDTNTIQIFAYLPEKARRFAEAAYLQNGQRDLLTVQEAYNFLTISRSTLFRKTKTGEIPSVYVAGVLRYNLSDLALIKSGENYFSSNTPPQKSAPYSDIAPYAAAIAAISAEKKRGRIPKQHNPEDLLRILNA